MKAEVEIMTPKRVFAFGEPENDGERRVIRFLDQHLPTPYRITLIANL